MVAWGSILGAVSAVDQASGGGSGGGQGGGGIGGILGSLEQGDLALQAAKVGTGALMAKLSDRLSGDTRRNIGAMSPFSPALWDIFGVKLVTHGHGSDKGLTEFVPDPDNPGAFVGLKDVIRDYGFNPISFYPGEESFLAGVLGEGAESAEFRTTVARSQRGLRTALEEAMEGARTGFPVDTSAVYDVAGRELEKSLAQVAETAGAGFGLGSSPFMYQSAETAEDWWGQAAMADIAAKESAAGRQAGYVDILPRIASGATAFPLNVASDIYGLGSMVRAEREAMRRRPIDLFTSLSTLGSGGGGERFYQAGYPTTSAASQALGLTGDMFKPT
jgi:hypothetical protein